MIYAVIRLHGTASGLCWPLESARINSLMEKAYATDPEIPRGLAGTALGNGADGPDVDTRRALDGVACGS